MTKREILCRLFFLCEMSREVEIYVSKRYMAYVFKTVNWSKMF